MKKKIILVLVTSLCASSALAQDAPNPHPERAISDANSSILVKMTSSMNSTSSKVGDAVTGELIDPRELRGALVDGKVDRADHDILSFSFDTIRVNGKSYPIQSKLVSVTSSKGNEGRDDLDQRVRIEGAGIIAYGVTTALDEGAEVRVSAWKK